MTYVKELLSDDGGGSAGKNPRNRKRSGCLTKLGIVSLVLVLILGSGVYFSRHWLADKTEALIKKELDSYGYFLDYHEVSYSWKRGLIIKGFTLFNEADRKNPLVVVTDVAANIELAELLTDGRAVGVFSAEGSDVIFYGEKEVKLTGFDADIYINRDGIEIRHSNGNLEGLDLDISGNMLWGDRLAGSEPEPEGDNSEGQTVAERNKDEAAVDFSIMDQIATWFAVQSGTEAPKLKIQFDGNYSKLARAIDQGSAIDGVGGESSAAEQELEEQKPLSPLEAIKVVGSFSGEDFVWRGLPVREMHTQFTILEGEVKANKVHIRHDDGELSLTASYGTDGVIETEGKTSGIDFFKVLGHLPFESVRPPEGYVFNHAPDINWKATFPSAAPLEGDIEAEISCEGLLLPFGKKQLDLADLSGTLTLRENEITVDDFSGTLRSGAHISVQGAGRYGLATGDAKLTHIALQHGRGEMEADVSWDSNSGRLETRGKSKGIDVFELKSSLPFDIPFSLPENVQLVGIPSFIWDATILPGGSKGNRLELKVGGDAGLNYVADQKQLLVRPVTGTLQWEDGVLSSDDVQFGVFGGSGGLRFQTLPDRENPTANIAVAAGGVSVQEVTEFFSDKPLQSPVPGTLSITYAGLLSSEISDMQGRGGVSIQGGKIYTFPVLGPINLVLGDLAPNFSKDVANNLEAEFTVEDGVLHTDNLVAESSFSRVKVKGGMDLANSGLNLTANANLKGVAGVATAIASKLFEMEVSGTLADPKVRLLHNPLRGIGNVAHGVSNTVGKGINGVGKVANGVGEATKKVVGTVAEGVGGAAGEVGKTVGKVGMGVVNGVGSTVNKLGLGNKDKPDEKVRGVVIPEVIEEPEPSTPELPLLPDPPSQPDPTPEPDRPPQTDPPSESEKPEPPKPVVPEVIQEPEQKPNSRPIVPEVIEDTDNTEKRKWKRLR